MNIACPLCGSNTKIDLEKYSSIGSPEHGCKIVQCSSCFHYYSTIEEKLDLTELYSDGAYKLINTKDSLIDQILSIEDKLIIRQLSRLKLSRKKLLDFGCGKGRFIHRASKHGWQVQGLETSQARAKFGATEYGLEISTLEYKTGSLSGGPFNVITLFHVLEHLNQPKELLKELCLNNLVENGYLVIEVPLFNSIQSKLAGKNWIHLDPPLHISHFTKTSLVKLFDELNITPVKYEYSSIHLGILGMIQSIMSLFGYKKMLISELKFRRSIMLIISVFLALPLALVLEMMSILLGKGGVIRVYCKNTYATAGKTHHNLQI